MRGGARRGAVSRWVRLPILIALALPIALARADSTPPADPWRDVEVRELPAHGTLRVTIDRTHYQGCSYSYRTTVEQLDLALTIEGAGATVDVQGLRRELRGGRSSGDEPPRLYDEKRSPFEAHLRGAVRRAAGALEVQLDGGRTLACRVESVKQDADPTKHAGALVCRAGDKGLALGSFEAPLTVLPFGRGLGYRTGDRFPQIGGVQAIASR